MARIDRWLSGGFRTVMLPSGEIFALKMPEIEAMLQANMIPSDLRGLAMKFGATSIRPETMDTDALAELLRFVRTLVAYSLRYVWDGPVEPITAWQTYDAADAHWQAVTVTVADLEEASIDGDDYAALHGIVTRQISPNEITTGTLLDQGLIDRGDAERRMLEARAEGTASWSSFRGERRSSDAGEASGDMVDGPVEPDRAGHDPKARSRRRVPAERRSVSSPDRSGS